MQATMEPEQLASDKPKRPEGFVFGVGMPLTGEDELAEALRSLGYQVREGAAWHWKGALTYLDRGQGDIAIRCLRHGYNAWVGWPVVIHQQLFQRYPDARYVLTWRLLDEWLEKWQERQAWLADHRRWRGSRSGRIEAATIKHLFGEAQPSLGQAQHACRKWETRVEQYLRDRDAKLCVVDVNDEDFRATLELFLRAG